MIDGVMNIQKIATEVEDLISLKASGPSPTNMRMILYSKELEEYMLFFICDIGFR